MYLPTFVTFRFTDILRSYVAQPIMWNAGYRLGFTNATVTQKEILMISCKILNQNYLCI